MMDRDRNLDGHEKFKELAAWANSGTLTSEERLELKKHLRICPDCVQVYRQYRILGKAGMPLLAAASCHPQELENWDDTEVREKLLASVAESEQPMDASSRSAASRSIIPFPPFRLAANAPAKIALVACLVIAAVLASYHVVTWLHSTEKSASLPLPERAPDLAAEKEATASLMQSQSAKISQMQEQYAAQQREIGRLRAALLSSEERLREAAAAGTNSEKQAQAVAEERDGLMAQLREAERSYQNAEAELVSLRGEHERTLLHTTALQTKVDEFAAANRDQERKLGDDERFLASDRDIRELMGARKLYIADVFDVDSGSRTRKPFGRVFYTQNKSLIFYAFDLDRQAGVKNASIFQVWGSKDAEPSEAHAMKLGILYLDSESNRRWALRLDDPKQLAEIDAVFVTVEPHVGSPKPTGKPFLYALLRKEANHP